MAARGNALILCVDDYENILAGWKMLLEGDGYEVLTAADASRAMELFIAHPVDEVILDYHLPGVLGDVVARQMKSLKPRVPILMLSGDDALPEEKIRLADAFLFKADSIRAFLTTVKTLLNPISPAAEESTVSNRNGRVHDEAIDVFCSPAQAKLA